MTELQRFAQRTLPRCRGPRRVSVPAASTSLIVLFMAGCGQSLDRFSEVKDLRILAVRASPPMVVLDRAAELPAEVVFDALVINPQGGATNYVWRFCPVESTRACADFEMLRDTAIQRTDGPDVRATLNEARNLTLEGAAEPFAQDVGQPRSAAYRALDIVSFRIPTSTLLSLQSYYRDNGFFGFGMGAWPSVTLEVRNAVDSVTAVKRLVVTVAELSVFNEAIAPNLGYAFCSAEITEKCLPWKAGTVGNTNPNLNEPIGLAPGDSAAATFRPVCASGGDPAETDCAAARVAAGESVRILPSFPEDVREPYQILDANLETRVVQLKDQVEEPSVSWFASAGTLRDEITWPLFTQTLDTAYKAPGAPAEGSDGTVVLWLVANDGRGGTDWQHLELEVSY